MIHFGKKTFYKKGHITHWGPYIKSFDVTEGALINPTTCINLNCVVLNLEISYVLQTLMNSVLSKQSYKLYIHNLNQKTKIQLKIIWMIQIVNQSVSFIKIKISFCKCIKKFICIAVLLYFFQINLLFLALFFNILK